MGIVSHLVCILWFTALNSSQLFGTIKYYCWPPHLKYLMRDAFWERLKNQNGRTLSTLVMNVNSDHEGFWEGFLVRKDRDALSWRGLQYVTTSSPGSKQHWGTGRKTAPTQWWSSGDTLQATLKLSQLQRRPKARTKLWSPSSRNDEGWAKMLWWWKKRKQNFHSPSTY